VVGSIYGGPAGGAIGGQLGSLAAGALTGGGPRPPAPRAAAPPAVPLAPPVVMAPPGPTTVPPAVATAAPGGMPQAAVAAGSDAAKQALFLSNQKDVLRSLVATALGQLGRTEVSGIPNAKLLNEVSRLFGQAAADADALTYLEQETESTDADGAGGPPGTLYADLLGADNLELAEAAEWGEPY
jgi:hypothetical protein